MHDYWNQLNTWSTSWPISGLYILPPRKTLVLLPFLLLETYLLIFPFCVLNKPWYITEASVIIKAAKKEKIRYHISSVKETLSTLINLANKSWKKQPCREIIQPKPGSHPPAFSGANSRISVRQRYTNCGARRQLGGPTDPFYLVIRNGTSGKHRAELAISGLVYVSAACVSVRVSVLRNSRYFTRVKNRIILKGNCY